MEGVFEEMIKVWEKHCGSLKEEIIEEFYNKMREREIPYYDRKEILQRFKIGQSTLNILLENGLRPVKTGNKFLFDARDVTKVLDKMKEKQKDLRFS